MIAYHGLGVEITVVFVENANNSAAWPERLGNRTVVPHSVFNIAKGEGERFQVGGWMLK